MNQQQYLETYLNDHRAGSTAGTALARRILEKNSSGPWTSQIQELVAAIDDDEAILDQVRAITGVTGGHLRKAGAMVVERASRLKMNGHLLSYSPLSRVLELEALTAGVRAKQCLWSALGRAAQSRPELAGFDFATLEEKASDQIDTLGRIHEWAVSEILDAEKGTGQD